MAELPSSAYMAAHMNDDRRPIIYGVCAMFMLLATIAVLMRLGAKFVVEKQFQKSKLQADDYLAILSLFLIYTLCASTFVVAEFGIGRRAFTLTTEDNLNIAKGFLAFELNYPCVSFAVKMTVLMLYRNLFFVMENRVFFIGWWCNAFLAFAYTVSLIVDTLTQCKSVPELWSLDVPPGDCRTGSATSLYVFAGLNAFSDLCILSLPIPIVWSMHMATSKKLTVLSIFFLGFIAVLISFIRIYSLKTGSGSTSDPAYDQVDALIWTVAEPTTGLICACLPVMRPALFKMRAKYQSSKTWLITSTLGYGSGRSSLKHTANSPKRSDGALVEQIQVGSNYPLDQISSFNPKNTEFFVVNKKSMNRG